jgi:lysophospholipase L1-like esterase
MKRVTKLALGPLLLTQALWTRRRTPRLPEAAGPREGATGSGPLLRLLIVGDSSAAGVGVVHQRQALAAQLSRHLADLSRRRVHWQLLARTGLTSEAALQLAQSWDPDPAELALVVLGVNDVVDQVPVPRALAARQALADWLLETVGVRHVVFAALPPMDRFTALPWPLRAIAGAEARAHDRALAAWAAACDDVSYAPLGFSLEPAHLARDGFHPSEVGYRTCGRALAERLDFVLDGWSHEVMAAVDDLDTLPPQFA